MRDRQEGRQAVARPGKARGLGIASIAAKPDNPPRSGPCLAGRKRKPNMTYETARQLGAPSPFVGSPSPRLQAGPPEPAAARRRIGIGAALLFGVAVPAAAVLLGFLTLGGSGCGNRAGMTCQQQSDCSAGLLCNKPPAAGPQSFGICEPGLHGLGEICVSSAECDPDLLCSTEIGQPSEDGWHGVCQERPAVDAAVRDLSTPPDLQMPSDQAALDSGSDI